MEKGMKEVPSSMASKARWVKIAKMVDGKTDAECFTRFKDILAKIKAAK